MSPWRSQQFIPYGRFLSVVAIAHPSASAIGQPVAALGYSSSSDYRLCAKYFIDVLQGRCTLKLVPCHGIRNWKCSGLIVRTGQDAVRATFSATLPRRI